MSIGRKGSHRLTGELLVARLASEGKQPIAPTWLQVWWESS